MTLQSTLVLIGTLISNVTLTIIWTQWNRIRPFVIRFEKHTSIIIAIGLLSVYIFIFFIYKFPITGDVVNFFIPQGIQALSGQIPNRDFSSSYMPLFPYITGAIYSMYEDEHILGLFFTLCMCVFAFLFPVFLRQMQIFEASQKVLLINGFLNSAIWVLGVGYQQDELYTILLLGLLFITFNRKLDFLTGIITGFVLLLTKITTVIFWLPFFLLSNKKSEFVAGLGFSTIPIMGLFIALGFSPTRMLAQENTAVVPPSLITNFQVIPSIYLFLHSNPLVPYFINMVILGLIGVFVLKKKPSRSPLNLLNLTTAIWLLFILLSLKSLTSYRILVIPLIPFILEVYRQRWKWIPFCFAAYCSLISIHVMFYEDWDRITKIHLISQVVPPDQRLHYVILTMIEFFITIFEVFWVSLALKTILDTSSDIKYQTNPQSHSGII